MRTLVLVAVLLLAACSARNRTADPAPDSQQTQPSAPSAPDTPSIADEPAPAATPPALGVGGLRPGTPRTAQTSVEGCLAETEKSEAAAAAHAPTRGGMDGVAVTTTGSGAIVTHQFNHACCLAADVTTEFEASQIVVTERLTGDPCRCMCRSTLKTAIGLALGAYTLEYRQHLGDAEPRIVATESVAIETIGR